ncbi:MAG: TIGR03087 family PEP-CTERM/XrtA system glycosyltransferase [Rhodocyclaceae bacterium]
MSARPALLYLTHRIPYPPNKGDKVRSFNLLRQLAASHRVFLGTFIDDPADAVHVPALAEWCEEVFPVAFNPLANRLRSLRGLLSGEALSVPYYRHRMMREWVKAVVDRQDIALGLVFSGPMAQYLEGLPLKRRVIDFCDVDSAKWAQYAEQRRGPMAWLYRREARLLLDFEQRMAAAVEACTFVTEEEAALFHRLAPGCPARVVPVCNGVDARHFAPGQGAPSPYPGGALKLVFTGAMDYWPNIDAVRWFVHSVLPQVAQHCPGVCFYIVGMNPAPEVQALASGQVVVTGAVDDIRPWIEHADVVVAPLRIARGIQNKVLEAMAMARPVVVSAASAAGLEGVPGQDFMPADEAEDFVARILELSADAGARERMGQAARECVLLHYSWQAHLAAFDALLSDEWPTGQTVQRRVESGR